MLKTSTIFMLTALLMALSGCGVGEGSGIIPTNGATAGDGTSDDSSTAGTSPDGTASGTTYEPCANKVCGDVCQQCDPNDLDCNETNVVKACNEAGECVMDTGDLCDEVEPEPYEPCAGKVCGDMCQQCDPNDLDCVETDEIKACNPDGECVSDTGDLCDGEEYDACAGKSCGDMCQQCDPNDLDCFETEEIKACNEAGECVSDTGDLCDGEEYDACAGKSCGDMCTLCDPADLDCAETMEIKACNPDGECVSDTGDLCDEVSACAESALPADNFMAGLEWAGGCGDMVIYAASPDGTMEVNLSIWGVCEEAHSSGGVLTRTYNLPDSGVDLNLNLGSNVNGATCNDALDWENPVVINHSIAATAGTITISATPDGEATAWSIPTVVTVTLSDAVFTDIDGCTSTVTGYSWTGVYVGWMAG
ncbi:MAG: hypothetical protein HOI23_05615 [Deltaproteobacteria bacterium]|nr:hypothetical protein [Deltaproteobacteria bacterium]